MVRGMDGGSGELIIPVALNGVTGRMGYNQHLVRSVLAINADGGVPLPDGRRARLAPPPTPFSSSAMA
jgi:hypothetical protein